MKMRLIFQRLSTTSNFFALFGYLIFAALAVANFSNPSNFILVFFATCLYSILVNRTHVNIVALLSILLVFKVVEFGLLELTVHTRNSYIIYSIYFLVDIPVIIAIALRVHLFRYFDYKKNGQSPEPDKYLVTNADLIVGKIYIMYCLINFLALAEHALRHLEDFGFPEDASYTVYLYENARFIWSNFAFIKHFLNVLEFIAVFGTISNYMRSERMLKA